MNTGSEDEKTCPDCGFRFQATDDRMCPKCHAREHTKNPFVALWQPHSGNCPCWDCTRNQLRF